MPRSVVLAAVVAAALVLAGCGDAEDDFRDQFSDMGLSDESVDCLIAELDERGLSVEDISDEALDGAALPAPAVEAFEACTSTLLGDMDDVAETEEGRELIEETDPETGLTTVEAGFLEGLTGSGLDDATARCVLDGVQDEGVDLLDLATDPGALPPEVEQIVAGCVGTATPTGDDEVGAEGGSYGDDPALDALWEDCAAGDGQACDDLYWQSPLGSEYEAFGDTCGGRDPAGAVTCVE